MDKEKPTKKKRSVLRIIGNTVFGIVVGLFAVSALANGIDRHTGYNFPLFGYRSSVVVSSSMANANPSNTYLTEDMHRIYLYDVVTTQNASYEDVQVYDVVTFLYQDSLICHRVIDKYENETGKYIVTQGDANSTPDGAVNFELFRGKVVYVTAGAGKLVLFFQSTYFLLALFGAVFFVALGMYISTKAQEKRAKQEAAAGAGEPPTKPKNEKRK